MTEFKTSGFVGIPFVDGGRDRAGCDCWGLVCLVYAENGIELPAYADISASDMRRISKAMRGGAADFDQWQRIKRAEITAGDVVLMQTMALTGSPFHIGIVTADHKLLHVEERTDSVIVPLNHASVGTRIFSFHRFCGKSKNHDGQAQK